MLLQLSTYFQLNVVWNCIMNFYGTCFLSFHFFIKKCIALPCTSAEVFLNVIRRVYKLDTYCPLSLGIMSFTFIWIPIAPYTLSSIQRVLCILLVVWQVPQIFTILLIFSGMNAGRIRIAEFHIYRVPSHTLRPELWDSVVAFNRSLVNCHLSIRRKKRKAVFRM